MWNFFCDPRRKSLPQEVWQLFLREHLEVVARLAKTYSLCLGNRRCREVAHHFVELVDAPHLAACLEVRRLVAATWGCSVEDVPAVPEITFSLRDGKYAIEIGRIVRWVQWLYEMQEFLERVPNWEERVVALQGNTTEDVRGILGCFLTRPSQVFYLTWQVPFCYTLLEVLDWVWYKENHEGDFAWGRISYLLFFRTEGVEHGARMQARIRAGILGKYAAGDSVIGMIQGLLQNRFDIEMPERGWLLLLQRCVHYRAYNLYKKIVTMGGEKLYGVYANMILFFLRSRREDLAKDLLQRYPKERVLWWMSTISRLHRDGYLKFATGVLHTRIWTTTEYCSLLHILLRNPDIGGFCGRVWQLGGRYLSESQVLGLLQAGMRIGHYSLCSEILTMWKGHWSVPNVGLVEETLAREGVPSLAPLSS